MKTHWKKAQNTPYLGSQDLPEYKDVTLTFDKVVCEKSHGLKENDLFNIAYFKENQKPMLINATNARVCKELSNSPYIEDWAGLKVTLYVETVKAFGSMHDALRIRRITKLNQTDKPVLNEKNPKWAVAKEKVKAGMTLAEIEKHYQISKEDFEKLKS